MSVQPHFGASRSRAIDNSEVEAVAGNRRVTLQMILAERISRPRDDPWLADLPSRPYSADMASPVGLMKPM